MSPLVPLLVYCLLVTISSLAGGWIPLLFRLTHTRLQFLLSFIGGAMLGVGLLHLMPHAFHESGSVNATAAWLLGGFLAMFFIERVFHFHHHDAPEDLEAAGGGSRGEHHSHGPREDGHSGDDHGHTHSHASSPVGWQGAIAGLALHGMLDGVALSASVQGEAATQAWPGWIVFLVVFLHKPFDSLTLGTLMAVAKESRRTRHLVNALFALSFPLGVVLFQVGVDALGETRSQVIGAALAFAAGVFLCISTSDLLPELQFHSHDRAKLSGFLLLGVALAGLMVFFEEKGHEHGQDHAGHGAHHAEEEHHDDRDHHADE